MENQTQKSRFANACVWFREVVIYVLFWIITAIAAFQGGVIFEHYRMDDYARRFLKIENGYTEINGKVTAHEATLKQFKVHK